MSLNLPLNPILKTAVMAGLLGSSLLLSGCLAGGDSATGATASAAPTASTSTASTTAAPTPEATTPEQPAAKIDSTAQTTSTGGAAYDQASPFPSRSGLLWKAVSHGFSGRLIVLIPKSWASFGSTVMILDAAGNPVEKGDIYHPTDPNVNGGRRHFLFDKTGRSYGNNLVLSFEGRNYQIPNGGARYD